MLVCKMSRISLFLGDGVGSEKQKTQNIKKVFKKYNSKCTTVKFTF